MGPSLQKNNSKIEPGARSFAQSGSPGGARACASAGTGSRSPEKARCPFKRPRISGPAFLPGAPAVIDAGRREEAPGANKSPARGRAAPGRESLLARGTRNKWPPRPPRGSRGRAGAPRGGCRAGEPRPPARFSPTAEGSGRADGDPAAAARRASGRPRGAGSPPRCARWPGTRILRAAAAPGPTRSHRGCPAGTERHLPLECRGRPRSEPGPGAWGMRS